MPPIAPTHDLSSSPQHPQAATSQASVGLPCAEPDGNLSQNAIIDGQLTNGRLKDDTETSSRSTDHERKMRLELENGEAYEGFGFGAKRSVAGELVFQTGMVGYPESITDPSYRGQILVVTFPLIGNYGVPSRDVEDQFLCGLPAHFESTQIHVSGLVIASYSGEDYSHHLATSSLGTWLKEQEIPAIYGVDTRALTKRIRQEGSMLGRLLAEAEESENAINGTLANHHPRDQSGFEQIGWFDPNTRNLVADGESVLPINRSVGQALTFVPSLYSGATNLLSAYKTCTISPIWPSFAGIVC